MGELKIEIEKGELLDKALSDMVCSLIKKGAEIFEKEDLVPILFIFNSKTKQIAAVLMNFTNQREKEGMAEKAKELVKELKADATLFICESWILGGDEAEKFLKNKKESQSLANHPDANDCVMFAFESRQGNWGANPLVLENKKLEESIKLNKLTSSEGLMSNFIHLKSVAN